MAVSSAVQDAAGTGDRLKALEALRDRLAREIDESGSARDVAALSQRLMDVLAQVEGLREPAEKGLTPLDELERRRRSREDASRQDRSEGAAL